MPAALVYDFYKKQVIVPDTDTSVSMQYLVDQTRTAEDELNTALSQTGILRASGKDDLGVGVFTGITVTLLDNWQVKFTDRPGPTEVQCFITGGNLVGGIANNPIATSSFVRVVQNQSASATIAKSDTDQNIFYAIESLRKTHKGVGSFIYWDPVSGNNAATGESKSAAVKDFAVAHSLAVSGNFDTIICIATSSATIVDQTLPITKHNLRVRGPGYAFQIKSTNTASDTININASGVEISGLYIETASSGTRNAINIQGSSNLITDCWVGYARANGINISSASNTRIASCAIENYGASGTGDGIKMGNTTTQAIISGNIIAEGVNGISLSGTGIADNVIENNLIYNNSAYGITVGSGVLRTTGRAGNTLTKNTSGNINDAGTDTFVEPTAGTESASQIANAVWDELIADHATANTTGRTLSDAKKRATLASLS